MLTSKPSRLNANAAARPAGPAPMTATRPAQRCVTSISRFGLAFLRPWASRRARRAKIGPKEKTKLCNLCTPNSLAKIPFLRSDLIGQEGSTPNPWVDCTSRNRSHCSEHVVLLRILPGLSLSLCVCVFLSVMCLYPCVYGPRCFAKQTNMCLSANAISHVTTLFLPKTCTCGSKYLRSKQAKMSHVACQAHCTQVRCSKLNLKVLWHLQLRDPKEKGHLNLKSSEFEQCIQQESHHRARLWTLKNRCAVFM